MGQTGNTGAVETTEVVSDDIEAAVVEGVRPVGWNILVTVERNDQTQGGIIKPSAHSGFAKWARVLAVGEEVTVCKAGDKILIEDAAYKQYVFNGYYAGMMNAAQVKAVLSGDINVE
jgi:co-chaperonin GroES (HSP10)